MKPLDQPRCGCCSHVGGEPVDGRSVLEDLSLSFSLLCMSAFQISKFKNTVYVYDAMYKDFVKLILRHVCLRQAHHCCVAC